MRKIIIFTIVLLMLFSFNILAQEENLNTENKNIEESGLSQEKSFSQSAREELIGIASQFDSDEDLNINQLDLQDDDISLAETTINNTQHLNLLNNLNFDANYSKREDEKLESAADFQLEYALNSRTWIRAGYSLLNEEGWTVQNISSNNQDNNNDNQEIADDSVPENENYNSSDNNISRVYQNDIDSSHSLGVAYKSSDRVILSADFIDNNEFGSSYNEDWDVSGESTVFGLEYSYPEGSSIRARYQIDSAENVTQRITGLDFAFNNLAIFSASYKLLDPAQLENTLIQQQSAWDLGLGVNLNEDYGLALGYELIESEDQKEAERKIKASFEINF